MIFFIPVLFVTIIFQSLNDPYFIFMYANLFVVCFIIGGIHTVSLHLKTVSGQSIFAWITCFFGHPV